MTQIGIAAYLCEILWNTSVKVNRGHHIPSRITPVDVTHF